MTWRDPDFIQKYFSDPGVQWDLVQGLAYWGAGLLLIYMLINWQRNIK